MVLSILLPTNEMPSDVPGAFPVLASGGARLPLTCYARCIREAIAINTNGAWRRSDHHGGMRERGQSYRLVDSTTLLPTVREWRRSMGVMTITVSAIASPDSGTWPLAILYHSARSYACTCQ